MEHGMQDLQKVCVIGSGPMAIYSVKRLITANIPLRIDIFEATDDAGKGMPYREDTNAEYMLCNAFSREIPSVTRPLIDWLEAQPPRELDEWELSTHDLSPRAFYPRTLIGDYLGSEFSDLCRNAGEAGYDLTIHTGCEVQDVSLAGRQALVQYEQQSERREQHFDFVIIATGHSWPETPEIDGARLVSPWPYHNVEALPETDIGVLGSSLSAIDVVLSLGHAHGRFEETGDQIVWLPNSQETDLRVTMVSKNGVMPEGDFYYPFPYEPLMHLTQDAVAAEIDRSGAGLLQRTFALLCAELDAVDPDYLANLGDAARTLEGFAPAYFSHRQQIGGLAAVKDNLAEVRKSMRKRETVPYRYALLRGHEVVGTILNHLSDAEYQQFLTHLMPVFGDCYAAIPHISLARIVAMYDAGVLELLATAENAEFTETDDGGTGVTTVDGARRFAAMVDARGQSAEPLSKLPFPSLASRLPSDSEPILAPFRLSIGDTPSPTIYCLALPQILQRHPFSQGLANCDELAKQMAEDLMHRVAG